jgi:glycine/D-amino acid oxidase-like deaminating enzyme
MLGCSSYIILNVVFNRFTHIETHVHRFKMPDNVCVIGAGVIGLSTAIQIQETYPSAKVTVIADKFDKETLSDGAAGLFRPTTDLIPGVPRWLLK